MAEGACFPEAPLVQGVAMVPVSRTHGHARAASASVAAHHGDRTSNVQAQGAACGALGGSYGLGTPA